MKADGSSGRDRKTVVTLAERKEECKHGGRSGLYLLGGLTAEDSVAPLWDAGTPFLRQ